MGSSNIKPAPPAPPGSTANSVDVLSTTSLQSHNMPSDETAQFLKLQLQASDTQINGLEDKMTKQNDVQTDLGNLGASLSKYPQGVTDKNPAADGAQLMTAQQIQDYRNSNDTLFDKAISDAGGKNTPEGQQLQQMKDSFDSTFGTNGNSNDGPRSIKGADNDWSATDVENMGQNIKNLQSSINTDSSMDMITMQSYMSQRQTYIQLTTNMLQSQNDGTKSIVENVGK